jgi:hypothetical protein
LEFSQPKYGVLKKDELNNLNQNDESHQNTGHHDKAYINASEGELVNDRHYDKGDLTG